MNHLLSFTAKAAAMLLLAECLISGGTTAAEPAGKSASAKQSVTINTALLKNTGLGLTAAAPSDLQSFTEGVVSELSRQGSFKSWKHASLSLVPLGPGTHSWLGTLNQNGKPIGYLILTSTDDGSYMLSEYGQADSMPYNVQALFNRLEQLGIQPAGNKLPADLSISAQYSALLPYWKVSEPGNSTLYINAITAEELPLDADLIESASGGLTSRKGYHLSASTLSEPYGLNDPYDNISWLASPKLTFKGNSELIQAVKTGQNRLVFSSPGHNANYGAPFAITGIHSWSAAGRDDSVLYAASGKAGSRFLPASSLLSHGELRSVAPSRK